MDNCLTLADFRRHASGTMGGDAGSHFELHLTRCPSCKTAYQTFLRDNHVEGEGTSPLPASRLDETQPIGPVSTRADSRGSSHLGETEALSPKRTPPAGPPAARKPRRVRFPQIEGYTIRKILGRGGMGVVYEAIQEKLHRPVALKLLPAVVGSANPELVTRFQREAAAAAKLHHTNIIPIYDFGESRDGYYYAMELIHGKPLNVLVKRFAGMDAPLTSAASIAAMLIDSDLVFTGEDDGGAVVHDPLAISQHPSIAKGWTYYRQVTRWMGDVADALHHAHQQGMVHRDIKPGNLMLCTDGRIVVLDFGLVKSTDDQTVTSTGSILGTYRYMSPEQIRGRNDAIDARSDVYSLGATLYELLTFQPPYRSREQAELIHEIVNHEPVAPRKVIPSVPLDLQTICLKALEKEPSARYQTAKAMADDLHFHLRGMAIMARRQGPVRRFIKLVRRRRVETAAIVAAVLFAAASIYGAAAYLREQGRIRDGLMREGVARWHAHEWEPAAQAFGLLLSRDPDDYGALVNWASAYKDQYYASRDAQLLHRADELLERAVNVRPGSYEAWNVRGVVYQGLDRSQDAVHAYKKALELKADYYPIWVNLGTLYATINDLSTAEGYLQKGIELAGEASGSKPWTILGALQLQSRSGEALETLTKACTLSESEDVSALVLSAYYYLAQDGRESAWKAYDLAVSANTDSETAERAALARGERDETVARVKRTLALAALRLQRWERAIQAAQEGLAVGGQPAFAHFVQAVAQARLGDLPAAREHLAMGESTWPDALKQAPFYRFVKVGHDLWFDTAAELESLRDEARRLIEGSAPSP